MSTGRRAPLRRLTPRVGETVHLFARLMEASGARGRALAARIVHRLETMSARELANYYDAIVPLRRRRSITSTSRRRAR